MLPFFVSGHVNEFMSQSLIHSCSDMSRTVNNGLEHL